MSSTPGDPLAVGGLCRIYTAAAQLLVGDVVYLSAAGTVNKTAVTGTQVATIGVVVGGTATRMECIDDAAEVGQVASAAGDQVIVCHDGTAWMIADGAIAAGVSIRAGTTTAGRTMATALGTGADQGKVVGKSLEAAAGAGNAFRGLISIS